MKRAIIIIFVLFVSGSSYSQKKDSIGFLPKYAIGISPSAYINVYRGIQISQDFRFSKELNLTLESGFIFDGTLFANRDPRGIRLRFGIEYLFPVDKEDAFSVGIFFLKRYIQEDLQFEVNHWEQRYFRRIPVKRTKDLKGSGMSLDFKQKILQRFHVDFGFGIGIGTFSINDKFYSEDRENLEYRGWYAYDTVGDYFFPIVFFNINFSYVIIK